MVVALLLAILAAHFRNCWLVRHRPVLRRLTKHVPHLTNQQNLGCQRSIAGPTKRESSMWSYRLHNYLMMGILMCTLSQNLVAQDSAKTQSPSGAAAPPAAPAESEVPLSVIEKAYEGAQPPESVKMLLAIVRGSKMGPGDGWFGPADCRYSWKWLAERHGIPETEGIPADKFLGEERWFARLDRNKDGRITADDFDWSEGNSWVQQSYQVNRLFRRIETTGDGKLSREEWNQFFDAAAGDKDHLLSEDFREAMLGGNPGAFAAGDAPSQATLIRGLFAGEVGSLNEGPRLNAQAPDFTLKTHDGKQAIRLRDLIGQRPVVITFGNFTCGPFRSMFPGVETIHKRFANEATFIAVYVREAHPTDGWKMESNKRVGIAVAQPKTLAERAAVATQCQALLKPSMPLLVDEINDPVGSAYSGMPARLYVIDVDGKVAYKSGRGPFGFKSGEMEQALIMTLLDRATEPAPKSEARQSDK